MIQISLGPEVQVTDLAIRRMWWIEHLGCRGNDRGCIHVIRVRGFGEQLPEK